MTKKSEELLRQDIFHRYSRGIMNQPNKEDNFMFDKKQNKRKLLLFQELCSKGLLDQGLELIQSVKNPSIISKAVQIAGYYNLGEMKRRLEDLAARRERENVMLDLQLSKPKAPSSTPLFSKKSEIASKAPELQTPSTTTSSKQPSSTKGSTVKRKNPFSSKSSSKKS